MSDKASHTDIPSGWLRRTTRVTREINLAWWLETIATPMVVLGVAGAAGVLLVRHLYPNVGMNELALWIAGAVALVSLVSWLIARRRFETFEGSMVRIEDTMQMGNALSAAKAGVRSWPPVPEKINSGYSWNWPRVVVPIIAAFAFLLAGLLIPVKANTSDGSSPTSGPQAWENIEADLERLEREDMIDEEYIEETKKQIEELRSRDEEEWFSHSSLEATDALEEKHKSEVARTERNLDVASRTLGSLQENDGKLSKERKDALAEQFDQALEGLQNGALKPNEELLEQLNQMDPRDLGNLNQEQMDQLRENLEKAKQACKDCKGGGGDNGDLVDALLDGDQPLGGEPKEGEQQGEKPGKGGINRGPGHAGGVLGEEGDPLAGGNLESLKAEDLSKSLTGDLLQLQDTEHETSEEPVKPMAGGGIGSTGTGGDRVWRESLDPDEQKTLKRFFE